MTQRDDAVEACEGVAYEDLRYLASQGGLVNLLETLRRYLAVAEADGISDDPTEEDDASIGVRGDGKPLCMTYWHIRQLNALLPPVGEGETPERHLTLEGQQTVSKALRRSGKVISEEQDERFQERSPERLRELTEEAQEAAREIVSQAWESVSKSNVSGLPDAEAEALGIPNPGVESDRKMPSKRVLEAIYDALLFVDAGEWSQDEHGDVKPEDYALAMDWVSEALSKREGGT